MDADPNPIEILRKIIGAIRELARHTTPMPSVMTLLEDADRLVNLAEEKMAGEPATGTEAGDPNAPSPPPPNAPPATDAGAEATGNETPEVPGDTPGE